MEPAAESHGLCAFSDYVIPRAHWDFFLLDGPLFIKGPNDDLWTFYFFTVPRLSIAVRSHYTLAQSERDKMPTVRSVPAPRAGSGPVL